MYQAFLSPRLVGKRFDVHTVPLEMLKDFSALEEMVVEVAKWKFRQAHPDSKRVQRNFSQGLELQGQFIGLSSHLLNAQVRQTLSTPFCVIELVLVNSYQ